MSAGSTHMLAPGGGGAFWTCGWPTPAHEALVIAIKTRAAIRIIVSLRDHQQSRAPLEAFERQRIGQAEQEAPALGAVRHVDARERLAPGVEAQAAAERLLFEIQFL